MSTAPDFFINVAIHPLDRAYTYRSNTPLQVGSKVTVPLHGRQANGFVVEIFPDNPCTDPGIRIREIRSTQPTEQCFKEDQLALFKWIASYYQVPLSEVIETAIPNLTALRPERWVALDNERAQTETIRGEVQREIIMMLQSAEGKARLPDLAPAGKSYLDAIRKLEQKGIVTISESFPSKQQLSTPIPANLNPQQAVAFKEVLASIEEDRHETFLLHGITGSGKTEVYINLIIETRARGRGCLVLVPEISLTPQLVSRLEEKIGERIAVLHSALGATERSAFWRQALQGHFGVVLGARSAVFSPLHNIGLIIVDEEHDSSFKQSDSLRYNGRDVAIVRAALGKCPIVLGSATPSLETFLNAKRGKYRLLELKERHGAAKPPTIECVDLTHQPRRTMASPNISKPLHDVIKETLEHKNQVFILFNRRGYASFILCDACGHSLTCNHCEVTLTYHEAQKLLLCHYCNQHYTKPGRCPKCSAPRLEHRGAGTEKIHEEVGNLFPTARVERLDRDKARKLEDYRTILAQVRDRKVDILVGTQMIAKGHNLPGVTLVGIIDCDIGLNFPDFRSAEKSFALLTQAAGRAGRGEQLGRVVLQTRNPTHLSIQTTLRHDFNAFALAELRNRKNLRYPPYWRLLRIVVSGPEEKQAEQALALLATHLEDYVAEHFPQLQLLGPSPAPIIKIKDRWRFHLMIKAHSVNLMQKTLGFIKEHWKYPRTLRVTFDIDPYDML